MKSKSCNFYHTNTKNPGDNPGIFFDPYNTADFEWLRWNIGDEILVVLVEIKHNTENFRQRSEIFSLY